VSFGFFQTLAPYRLTHSKFAASLKPSLVRFLSDLLTAIATSPFSVNDLQLGKKSHNWWGSRKGDILLIVLGLRRSVARSTPYGTRRGRARDQPLGPGIITSHTEKKRRKSRMSPFLPLRSHDRRSARMA